MNSKRKRSKITWSDDEDNQLLSAAHEFLRNNEDCGVDDLDLTETVGRLPPGKTSIQCYVRIRDLHTNGKFFATIPEVFPMNMVSISIDDTSGWSDCIRKLRRSDAPNFVRTHLKGDDRIDPREFVNTKNGAILVDSAVDDKSVTTVNDALIPVDIFGKEPEAAEKAHLLPKARNDAMTWFYPACAVLGLSLSPMNTIVANKAVLGCSDPRGGRYPGIRNLPCNIIRMSNQAASFHKNARTVILPARNLDFVKAWDGQPYDALVFCIDAACERRIGMTSVTLDEAERATLTEINLALGLASEFCKFLAHSVLQKDQMEVDGYNPDIRGKAAHAKFRTEKTVLVPGLLSALPAKPVFKISFIGQNVQDTEGHPAPDPMLLTFKSCSNLCRIYAGFRMVACSEPEDLDDDLSEEGLQHLRNYMAWQAAELKREQDRDIMDKFGGEAGISGPVRGASQ